MDTKEINELLEVESIQLSKLHKVVEQTMKDEDLIMDNLLHPPAEMLTSGQKLSDKIARFGGSWMFITLFAVMLIIWIVINSLLPAGKQFDPFPFILMNLVLSCIAALQAPIIMMSQNRQEEKDRQRAQNDYMINLKAELEIRSLHQKVDLMIEEQIKTLYEIQLKQLEMLKQLTDQKSAA
ncbi:MAG: DUF1003 domain-containing protein [Lacibacter sp.]